MEELRDNVGAAGKYFLGSHKKEYSSINKGGRRTLKAICKTD